MPELTPDVERELAAIDDALAGRRVAPDLTELGELALALREERPRPGATSAPSSMRRWSGGSGIRAPAARVRAAGGGSRC